MKVMGLPKLRQRSKSFDEAYPPSATATISRSGCQRLTNKSNCQAHSVVFLCRLPCSRQRRSEGANAHRNGSAQTREAQGIGANSATDTHLRALVFTKWGWLDLTGSR
jgi:hypothetical protein